MPTKKGSTNKAPRKGLKCKTIKRNPWLEHVDETRRRKPGLSYSNALKLASKSYTKKKQNKKLK